jgi:DNA-binding CsgD family transcriptional regulator
MYLSLETFAKSIRLIEQLSLLERPDQFAAAVLPRLAGIVGCDLITYNEMDSSLGRAYYREWPDEAARAFLNRTRLHEFGRHGEFFAYVPVEHRVSFTLIDSGPRVVGIALSRCCRAFDERDRAVLALLRGPLSRALAGLRRSDRMALVSIGPIHSPDERLTGQEAAVLGLVSEGLTNQAISHRLSISPRTVAKHLEHVYRKLDVANRAAAVAHTRAAEGLLPMPPERARFR